MLANPLNHFHRIVGTQVLRNSQKTLSLCESIFLLFAQIAQLVEQRTENPRVTGSIPVLGMKIRQILDGFFYFIP